MAAWYLKALGADKREFGSPSLTELLLAQWKEWDNPPSCLKQLTKACIDRVLDAFKKEASRQARGVRR